MLKAILIIIILILDIAGAIYLYDLIWGHYGDGYWFTYVLLFSLVTFFMGFFIFLSGLLIDKDLAKN
jgi:hypothetical protein